MGDVFERVRTLRAVREYERREIPEETLRRVLEAARFSASSMNRQPWHFVLVRGRDRLGELAGLLPTGRYTADAAAAVIVAYERESRFGVSDSSRAIQSMMLAAWDEGVGSNWVGFTGLDEVRRLAGLPDEYDVLAVIPLGYPKTPDGGGKKRRPFSDVVSEDRFGNPLPGS